MTPGIQHDRGDAIARAAADLATVRRRIAAQHAAGAPGAHTAGLASDLIDGIVVDIWRSVVAGVAPGRAGDIERHVALVAHGGYGRREMAPFSDVDLMKG